MSRVRKSTTKEKRKPVLVPVGKLTAANLANHDLRYPPLDFGPPLGSDAAESPAPASSCRDARPQKQHMDISGDAAAKDSAGIAKDGVAGHQESTQKDAEMGGADTELELTPVGELGKNTKKLRLGRRRAKAPYRDLSKASTTSNLKASRCEFATTIP